MRDEERIKGSAWVRMMELAIKRVDSSKKRFSREKSVSDNEKLEECIKGLRGDEMSIEDVVKCPICGSCKLMVVTDKHKGTALCGGCRAKADVEFD